jgi:hypothetical protein
MLRRYAEVLMRMSRVRGFFTAVVTVLLSGLFSGEIAAAAELPRTCRIHLLVELTPDVPDPRTVGFLSSLLSNHVSYQLTFNEERDGSIVDLELTGPGPDYRCQNVVEAMRRDGRVLSITRVASST